MYKQIKFRVTNPDLQNEEESNIFNGIAHFFDGEALPDIIICACCGSTFEIEDVEIIKVYDYWVNFSDYIGDE